MWQHEAYTLFGRSRPSWDGGGDMSVPWIPPPQGQGCGRGGLWDSDISGWLTADLLPALPDLLSLAWPDSAPTRHFASCEKMPSTMGWPRAPELLHGFRSRRRHFLAG